jgi:hypothetical protein
MELAECGGWRLSEVEERMTIVGAGEWRVSEALALDGARRERRGEGEEGRTSSWTSFTIVLSHPDQTLTRHAAWFLVL